jgi:invasion protein IalB
MVRTLLALFVAAPLMAAPLMAAQTALAQPAASGPQSLSRHDDWEVAFLTEGGARVCYAFTRRFSSEGAPAGRTAPVITVTHRPNSRDQIALLSGLTFPSGAEVPVEVGTAKFQFYTSGGSAFAREGRAVVTAFQRGRDAVFRIPAGGGRGAVTDRASLRGFSAAYTALDRCAGGAGAAAPRR